MFLHRDGSMSRVFMMVYIERLALEQYIERSMGIIETNR